MKRSLLFLTAVMMTTMLMVATVQANEANLPLVVKRMTSPVLDGKVDETEWASAGVIDAFVNNKSGGVEVPTKAYVGYDEKNIYLAFVCDEPAMSGAGTIAMPGKDQPIYNTNETVYIFLNPQADRTSYMQFIVDILNQRYDALGMDANFNPPWESKTSRDEKSWSVEMAIPFSSLTVPTPSAGDVWYADFFRLRQQGGEMTAWKPTNGDFASPGRFGTLIFDSLKACFEKELAELNAEKKTFPKELAAEGAKWQKKVESLSRDISSMNEDAVNAKYESFIREIESSKNEAAVLRRKAMMLSGMGLIVTVGRPYELFFGKASNDAAPAGPIQVSLLQDEWVDMAWDISNVTDETITVRCSVLDGKDAKGNDYLRMAIPEMDVNWCQAMPVASGDGRKMWDAINPIPTGVVQIAPGETVQVWLTLHANKDAKAGTQTFRTEITPIDGSDCQTVTIPVSANIIPLQITAKRYINVFTWNLLPAEVTSDKTWFNAHLDNMAAHGVNVYLIHNLTMMPRPKANADGTLSESMDFTKLDKILDVVKGKFDLYYMTTDIWEKQWIRKDLFGLEITNPNYEKAFKRWFAAILAHLKTKGITNENLLVNPYDECTDEKSQQIAKWMKEVDPQCKIVIDWSPANMDEAKKMDALTDVWVPHHRHFFQEELQPFHKMIRDSKKSYWCYFYAEGRNEKAQDPTLHYLSKFWWCYENNLVGIGYWAYQYYGNPWCRKTATVAYDTSMVYPVPGSVVDSRRWRAWRRGWQDYNLMSILREKLAKANDLDTLKQMNSQVAEVVVTPGNREKREDVRMWIKSKLE